MTPTAKRTLQRAAAAANKSVSEFLLDSSLSAAFDTLADRRVFQLERNPMGGVHGSARHAAAQQSAAAVVADASAALGSRVRAAETPLSAPALLALENKLGDFDFGVPPLDDWLK